ncbi:MAG: FtsX-like permease family protein [Gemmatimonadales bacterium]|nr:FtsX-like permease family protein [Gemmatimonadales bacterium]NIN10848.1 FtsX-like permease family protein [Gemmatimonadales bacterium]NIR02856.1 FtsX-like permease family protein [Gemmatimonadales bacterium]NIS66490.1 FtsX-like permease family protein [Gemmatimonadales bacterium]
MAVVLQDIRHAARCFARRPGFSLTVVAIVGLGVGATTTIFSVVDGVVLRDLPYPDSHQLVFFDDPAHPVPLYKDWRDRTSSFSIVAGWWDESYSLTGDGPPVTIRGALVTPGYFEMFRAIPHRGRLLSGDDFQGERPRVAVLSHGLWRTRWGEDESVIGRTIMLDGYPITVVGVLSPGFELPDAMVGNGIDVWAPLDPSHPALQSRNMYVLTVVARLRPGVSREAAQAEVDALSAALAMEYPETQRLPDGSPKLYPVVSLLEAIVGNVRHRLYLLLGAVALMLLIACANVANLFLARGTDREREMSLRLALGAGRRRVTTQLLTESITISLVGGALGAAIAYFGVDAFKWLNPGGIPRVDNIVVDQRVLWFALTVSVATGALFGLAPAGQAARTVVSDALKDLAATASTSRGRLKLRDALVACEIAVAFVLLIGAGLLFNSFVRLSNVDPGFEPENVMALRLTLGSTYSDQERVGFTRDLIERIGAIPGVEGVAAGVTQPLGTGGPICCWIEPVGIVPETADEAAQAVVHPVTPGYFSVLGTRRVQGREFTPADDDPSTGSAILNVALARRVFGDANVVGRSLRLGETSLTVVGVVDEIRHWGLQHYQAEVRNYNVYVPYAAYGASMSGLQVAVKSRIEPNVLVPALREAVWAVDPNLPVNEIVSMKRLISRSIAGSRFYSVLLISFATVAILLAAGGTYGSMLYSVRQRRQELGIRLALGAGQTKVVSMILRRGMLLAAIGIASGLVGGLALSRTLEGYLFGITAHDPSTLTVVSLLLGAVAFAACYLPARRASLADPMETLRVE